MYFFLSFFFFLFLFLFDYIYLPSGLVKSTNSKEQDFSNGLVRSNISPSTFIYIYIYIF